MASKSEGKKFDAEKPRFDLISPQSMLELAKVATFGATKYGDRNWEAGMDWHRPLAAMFRHINQWQLGEEKDLETGCNHMAAVMWNAMVLMHYQMMGGGTNDVFPTSESDGGKK